MQTTINTSTVDINKLTAQDIMTIKAASLQSAHDVAVAHMEQHGEQAYCGFAWVNIYGVKGNTRLGKAFKAAGLEKDYTGAYNIWNPSGLGTQCMATKEAGASACAKVWTALGFKAYAGSRAD